MLKYLKSFNYVGMFVLLKLILDLINALFTTFARDLQAMHPMFIRCDLYRL